MDVLTIPKLFFLAETDDDFCFFEFYRIKMKKKIDIVIYFKNYVTNRKKIH